jgi:hypothetical protein
MSPPTSLPLESRGTVITRSRLLLAQPASAAAPVRADAASSVFPLVAGGQLINSRQSSDIYAVPSKDLKLSELLDSVPASDLDQSGSDVGVMRDTAGTKRLELRGAQAEVAAAKRQLMRQAAESPPEN